MTDEEFEEARRAALEAILDSECPHKLIVAGPGTGKTFTFQQLLSKIAGRSLAMTFLTVLVQDLKSKFDETVEVQSFHGFARKLLHRVDVVGISRSVSYYPPLPGLVIEDVRIVDGTSVSTKDVGSLFRNLADEDAILLRALASGTYYDAVSHDDSVYRVLQELEDSEEKVPAYDQVVVDEFQDFCPMEVALIGVLARKSPTLVVGDDDQALYAFRDASPDAIRRLANDGGYKRFGLPFCTRCTQVLVESVHTVVRRATDLGLLSGRLDKDYVCYLPTKRDESNQYPKVRHVKCSVQNSRSPYMGKYILRRIAEIPAEEIKESHEGEFPTVLVIGPEPFLSQVESELKKVYPGAGRQARQEVDLSVFDAYKHLARDGSSNLGWRILLQILQPEAWEDAVRVGLESGEPLLTQVGEEFKVDQLEIVRILSLMWGGEEVGDDERSKVALALGIALGDIEQWLAGSADEEVSRRNEDEPSILLTSLMGSKGLQAAHVFVVGVNDGHFPRHNASPTNEEVCQLLVALTRGRKSCTLVSTGRLGPAIKQSSVFTSWLRPHLVVETVNKTSFK